MFWRKFRSIHLRKAALIRNIHIIYILILAKLKSGLFWIRPEFTITSNFFLFEFDDSDLYLFFFFFNLYLGCKFLHVHLYVFSFFFSLFFYCQKFGISHLRKTNIINFQLWLIVVSDYFYLASEFLSLFVFFCINIFDRKCNVPY